MTPDRYQLAGMHAMLCLWGSVCETVRNWNGYPSSDTTYRAAFGRGGNTASLPIPDIPTIVVRLNAKVLSLPEDHLEAVTLWYAFNAKPANGRWTIADKASVLGLTEQQLRRKVTRAKVLLLASCENLM